MSHESEALAELLFDVQRGLFERIRLAFREVDLPRTEMMVMMLVRREPGVTLSELARRCGIAKSHISGTVEALHQRGLVEKQADPADQRLVRLTLTEAASSALQPLYACLRGRLAEVTAAVPEEQQAALIESLQVLRDALQRVNERSGEP
jgi:DNA-binding MarR family transcriptional regulator